MADDDSQVALEPIVRVLEGDSSVLCVVIETETRTVIVVNSGYAFALDHASLHLRKSTGTGIWVCGPECDGA